jgi:N-acyl-phosphatidylethanolamine-hydrolysing phospholipase D
VTAIAGDASRAIKRSTKKKKKKKKEISLSKNDKVVFTITCTHSQHFTGRGLADRWKTLWATWVIEQVKAEESVGSKVFFAGDTGYHSVRDGQA